MLVRPWEKYVISLKYSELGAIRFDHDLRAVMAYLSSQTVLGDIRETFVRLQQIATVLNLDSVSFHMLRLDNISCSDSYAAGGGCRRVLQRVGHRVATEPTGGSLRRESSGIVIGVNGTWTLRLLLYISS